MAKRQQNVCSLQTRVTGIQNNFRLSAFVRISFSKHNFLETLKFAAYLKHMKAEKRNKTTNTFPFAKVIYGLSFPLSLILTQSFIVIILQ